MSLLKWKKGERKMKQKAFAGACVRGTSPQCVAGFLKKRTARSGAQPVLSVTPREEPEGNALWQRPAQREEMGEWCVRVICPSKASATNPEWLHKPLQNAGQD